MKDYDTAVKFERACAVRRLLEYSGRAPSNQDDLYIHELGSNLDNSKAARIFEPWTREAREWADLTQEIARAQKPMY